MATFTPNYNLRKPTTDDFVAVAADVSASMDTIDTELHDRETEITALDGRVDDLELGLDTWTAYTPTLGNWTLGNGTLTGAYVEDGSTVHFRIKLTVGSTTVKTGSLTLDLPVDPLGDRQGAYVVSCFDTSTNTYAVVFAVITASSTLFFRDNSSASAVLSDTNPFTWAAGDELSICGTYEKA